MSWQPFLREVCPSESVLRDPLTSGLARACCCSRVYLLGNLSQGKTGHARLTLETELCWQEFWEYRCKFRGLSQLGRFPAGWSLKIVKGHDCILDRVILVNTFFWKKICCRKGEKQLAESWLPEFEMIFLEKKEIKAKTLCRDFASFMSCRKRMLCSFPSSFLLCSCCLVLCMVELYVDIFLTASKMNLLPVLQGSGGCSGDYMPSICSHWLDYWGLLLKSLTAKKLKFWSSEVLQLMNFP